MSTYDVTLGVTRGKGSWWKRRWSVLTGNTRRREGEREIRLNITLPEGFFSGPVINVIIELPADHGVKVQQEK